MTCPFGVLLAGFHCIDHIFAQKLVVLIPLQCNWYNLDVLSKTFQLLTLIKAPPGKQAVLSIMTHVFLSISSQFLASKEMLQVKIKFRLKFFNLGWFSISFVF